MQLVCEPIGFLRCPRSSKFVTPSQPQAGSGRVELLGNALYDVALLDLAGFSRIWLIWWFHKNQGWRPKVQPPRGRSGRKGLFSTRSPHRPNPLGISAVPLLGVEGRVLHIGAHDLLDGTPILDVKPYLPAFDSFPDERVGWFSEVAAELTGGPRYQLEWNCPDVLPAEFQERARHLLERDPLPHRTRRILRMEDGYRLSCGDWRLFYRIDEERVVVERVELRSSPSGECEERLRRGGDEIENTGDPSPDCAGAGPGSGQADRHSLAPVLRPGAEPGHRPDRTGAQQPEGA